MRSGFVSFLGRPNAGKSTLLNRLVGAHLAGHAFGGRARLFTHQ